jgi:hypothetical protein
MKDCGGPVDGIGHAQGLHITVTWPAPGSASSRTH